MQQHITILSFPPKSEQTCNTCLSTSNFALNVLFEFTEIERMKKKWEEEMYAAMAENDRDLLQIKQSYDDKLKLSRQQKGFVCFLTFKYYHISY